MIPLPTNPWQPPYPVWYNPNVRCDYHGGVAGHSTEGCYALRGKIHDLVNTGRIKLNAVEQNHSATPETPKADASASGVNAIDCWDSEWPEEDIDEVNGVFMLEILTPGEPNREVIIPTATEQDSPLVLNIPKRSLYAPICHPSNSHESQTLSTSNIVVSNITGIGGITRTGRCYTPQDLARKEKGKAKLGEESGEGNPNAEACIKEAVTQEDVEQFLKYIKNSEYNVIEQLSKTPAKISLLSLILDSETHRRALLRVLNESHVAQDTSVEQVERLIGQIQAPNYVTFSDDELGPDGRCGDPTARVPRKKRKTLRNNNIIIYILN
jgi:hypothetical protein